MRHLAKTMTKALLALSAATLSLAGMATAQNIAIINAKIHMAGSVDDPKTIENGTIVIRNGVITSVGARVTVPSSATTIDAGGASVTPGLFAALSGIGLVEISLNGEGNDRSARGDFPLSAALNANDALNTDSSIIPITRAGGVTRAYTTPDPAGKLFGGCGAVINMSGDAQPILSECIAQNVVLGYAGARRTGDIKTGSAALFRYYLDEAKRYAENPNAYRASNSDTGLSYLDLEALANASSGDQKMLIHVESAPDIKSVLTIADNYGLDIVLVGAREAWRAAKELAAADVPVILNPMDNLPVRFEAMGATLRNAALLQEAGVTVAFYDGDIGYTHNVRLLPQLAGNAVANGMGYDAALAAITANPAKIWGVDESLGSLEAGKLADVVIWDGDPLELSTRPSTVIIDGKITSLENRQTALAKRYKDLTRGDLPPPYKAD